MILKLVLNLEGLKRREAMENESVISPKAKASEAVLKFWLQENANNCS